MTGRKSDMRVPVKVAILSLVALTTAGLAVLGVHRVRHAAALAACQNNLKQIGCACHVYHDVQRHFPTGTVPNDRLPPERRLSWLTQVWPAYMQGGLMPLLDLTEPWDAETNCPPRCKVRDYPPEGGIRWDERPVPPLTFFLCPEIPAVVDPGQPSPTHYVGVAGVGEGAACLPLPHPKAGFFGYDRRVTLADITDGSSATLLATEAADGGPWTAGGKATVRGLVGDGKGYLSEGGPFTSPHRRVTNLLIADGSVRRVSTDVAPDVLEALATVAGGEAVRLFDD
jgi:Protein of unknown function (DUF1559)